jgi:hypothetical protein
VEYGVDVNKRDENYLPIDRAILRNKLDMIQLLINNGAELETPNEFGFTPVLTAIAMVNKPAFAMMVEKGIDINKKTGPKGFFPLKYAVTNANTNMLATVLALNPDLNQKDPEGNTALHYAVMVNALEKIALLKTAGANPRIPNNAGRTAINLAQDLEDRGDNRAINLWSLPPRSPRQQKICVVVGPLKQYRKPLTELLFKSLRHHLLLGCHDSLSPLLFCTLRHLPLVIVRWSPTLT